MAWVTEFNSTTPDGKRVEYQTFEQVGFSAAERRDRVKVAGRVVHAGWVSDHRGFAEYRRLRDAEPKPSRGQIRWEIDKTAQPG